MIDLLKILNILMANIEDESSTGIQDESGHTIQDEAAGTTVQKDEDAKLSEYQKMKQISKVGVYG